MTLLITEMGLEANMASGRREWFQGASAPPNFPWPPPVRAVWAPPPESRASLYLLDTHLPRIAHPPKPAGATPSTWRSIRCGKEKKCCESLIS